MENKSGTYHSSFVWKAPQNISYAWEHYSFWNIIYPLTTSEMKVPTYTLLWSICKNYFFQRILYLKRITEAFYLMIIPPPDHSYSNLYVVHPCWHKIINHYSFNGKIFHAFLKWNLLLQVWFAFVFQLLYKFMEWSLLKLLQKKESIGIKLWFMTWNCIS